jgi:16S rRNA (adenine1518-N6/adenine1519-N6)-dimethyltransferase
MNIFRPTQLHAFLKERGMQAKKRLSQNFLIDGNVIQKIADISFVSKNDHIIEIGPGPGALTEVLLERGASVTAIEVDSKFAEALERLKKPESHLEIICCDILKFPLFEFLQKHPYRYKVVANLPYHITTPILSLLLPMHSFIDSLTIMVQKEYADRMLAKQKTACYSSFTIFLQFYATVIKSFTVSPNCFYPRPKILSSVVHCHLHPPRFETDFEKFFQLVRSAFGKRRKMLRASLKNLYPMELIEQSLIKIGYLTTTRPEELSIDKFIDFFFLLNPKNQKNLTRLCRL